MRKKKKKKKKKLKKLIEPYVSYPLGFNSKLIEPYVPYPLGFNSKVQELSSSERWQLKRNFQKNKGNFVSDFTSWIFESTKGQKYNQNMRSGAANEKKVYDKYIYEEPYRTRFLDGPDKSLTHFRDKYNFEDNWIIEYEHISSDKSQPAYRISSLRIDGKPLYGKPDIVLKNIKTNDRIIIEVKNTFVPDWKLISDKYKWLNIQCQLWAYSLIDMFKDSSNLYLLGDIWITKGNKLMHHKEPLHWRIRKEGKINVEEKQIRILHEKCKDIFENIYGGKIV